MPEKKFVRIPIDIEECKIDSIKSLLRSAGVVGQVSATEAIHRALDMFAATSKSVRLDEPERREIESRCGATVPIRNSREILRAFEKVSGGPDAVVVELDPSIGSLMRDAARSAGYGISEFSKIVIEDSYHNSYLEQCELMPVWFSAAQWKMLQSIDSGSRIRTAGEILALITKLVGMIPAETEECHSTSSPAASVS